MSDIGRGLCLGIGGSNARVGICDNGEVSDFDFEKTPSDTKLFFQWMADEIVKASHKGAKWAVIGVPGVVKIKNGSQIVGPLPNVAGLADGAHELEKELSIAREEVEALFHNGFTVICVNDGVLAAYAGLKLLESQGKKDFDAVASFIVGTGVGGAVIRRVPDTNIFRPSEGLFEIGHVPVSHDYQETFETTISGTGLYSRHGQKSEELDEAHTAWQEVGTYMGQLIMMLSLIAGVEAVVACGGVGSNHYNKYQPYLEEYLQKFKESSNAIHRKSIPFVTAVDPEHSQVFEILGAEGVMQYRISEKRKALSV